MLMKKIKKIIAKSQIISAAYRKIRDEKFLRQKPQITGLGFKFNGNQLMMDGKFEPIETKIIGELLSGVSVLINIGANIGYYTCIALHKGKEVVAFEPMNTNLHFLLRNVYVNNWADRFECYPLALADQIGLVKIYGSGTGASLVKGWAGQEYYTIVPVSTLDICLGNRFDKHKSLVVVDIEGAEFNMLKGAKKLLQSSVPPIWFVEIAIGEHQPEGVMINPNLYKTFKLFYDEGYTAWTADERNQIVSLEDIRLIEETRVDTLKTHNFIFKKIV